MSRIAKAIIVIFLIGILVLIRGFEEVLFYDPLTHFFKSVQSYDSLPQFETLKLLVNVVIRFMLNTLVSLGILWVLFQNKDIIKLSCLLYGALFVLLFAVYCYMLVSESASDEILEKTSETDNFMILFYVRRFLIQPLILFVLVPSFYIQNKKNNK